MNNNQCTISILNKASFLHSISSHLQHKSTQIEYKIINPIQLNTFFLIIANTNELLKAKLNLNNTTNTNNITTTTNSVLLSIENITPFQIHHITNIAINEDTIYIQTSNTNNEIVIYAAPKLMYDVFTLNNAVQHIDTIFQKKQIKQISCGVNQTLFLSHGGMVYSYTQHNDKQHQHQQQPTLITDLIEYDIEMVCAGNAFNFVYGKQRYNDYNYIKLSESSNNKEEKCILTWGDNAYGQCGFDNKFDMKYINKAKMLVKGKFNICNCDCVSLGLYHMVFVSDDNKVVLCGNNSYHQCNVNETNDNVVVFNNQYTEFNCFSENKERIIYVKASEYSTLFIGEKGTILIMGKINNGNYTLYTNINVNAVNLSDVIFNDNYCVLISNNNDNVDDSVEAHHSTLEVSQIYLPLNIHTTTNNEVNAVNNNNITSQYDNKAQAQDEINFDDLFIDTSLQNQLYSIDTSTNPTESALYELRSYINLLGISLSSTFESNDMSFRPSNLPPKTKEEEEAHRRLVYENRQLYHQLLKQKHQNEKEHIKVLEHKQETESKRANYWIKEIIPNWTTMKSTKNFEDYFYEGIPSIIRGQVWLLSVGNKFSITKDYYNIEVKKSIQLLLKQNASKKPTVKSKSESSASLQSDNNNNNNNKKSDTYIYSKYILKTTDKEESINIIELDIDRTFHYLGIFKNNSPLSNDLREILRAFVVSRPDIGYVQGLSYIAGTLLLQMDKFQSFVCLMNITLNPNILPFYRLEENGIKQRLLIFNDVFQHNLPKLFKHFVLNEVYSEHYLIEWIMTLYTRNLHIDLAVRIWDVYMVEGIKCLFKAAIVILGWYEKYFLSVGFEEILIGIKNVSKIKMDNDVFVENMKNVKFTEDILYKIQKLNEDYLPIDY